ncbi:MAG: carboxypeptidase-like regulatory domain-containing protein [Gemmatimonadaceae bacterium]
MLGGGVSDFVSFDLRRDSIPLVRFHLLKIGPGTVVAKVVDQASASLSNVDVELYSATQSIGRQRTGSDGRVAFTPVPFGSYGVRAFRPEAYRDVGEPVTLDVDGLVVEEGVTESRILALQRCAGTITLTVSNPTFGAGANIRTQLFRASGVVDARRTGTDGTVRYSGIDCDAYGVRMLPSADWVVIPGRGTEFLDGLILNRGTAHNVALPGQYNACRGSLRVTATDPFGTAVPGATVTISTSYDDPVLTRSTSSTGIAVFEALGCGPERTVNITAPSGWTATPGRGGTFMDGLLVRNEGTVNLSFTLTRAGT